MRLVLVIQSLIILGGAYYVYTLTRPVPSPVVETPSATTTATDTDTPPSDEQAGEIEVNTNGVTTTPPVIISDGHNDLGMEFPIPDEGLEVR